MLLQDLSFIEEQAGILSEAMEYLTGGSDEESVFWIEWSASGRAVAICGSPLRVDRRFADFLESSCESAVFTSATLAERGSFDFIKENLGIRLRPGQPLELVSGSPFSYGENCMITSSERSGRPERSGFRGEGRRGRARPRRGNTLQDHGPSHLVQDVQVDGRFPFRKAGP